MEGCKAEVKFFEAIYSALYDFEVEYDTDGYHGEHARIEELAEQFDDYLHDNEMFKEDVDTFNKARGDLIMSDREAAAYMIMYEYCM